MKKPNPTQRMKYSPKPVKKTEKTVTPQLETPSPSGEPITPERPQPNRRKAVKPAARPKGGAAKKGVVRFK